MKLAIIGAGNIGTALAALLASSGAKVTVVARGARLRSIASRGVFLEDRGTLHAGPVHAVEALQDVQDAVFLCVKAQDLGQAVLHNAAGIGPQTLVIPMVNGLPFWFLYGEQSLVPFTDPEGLLARYLRPEQVLGAVLLMTVQMTASGQAVSTNTPTLSLGAAVASQLDPTPLIARLTDAGVKTKLSDDIHQDVLVKLLANVATNPLSALTGCNLAEIGKDAQLRDIAFQVADEVRALAKNRFARTLPGNTWLGDLLLDAGDFPTSMLQDARAGRPLELDAICKAPLALARPGQMPCLAALLRALQAAPDLPLTGPAVREALGQLPSHTLIERTPS
jgi:2-dehydropantoate 2-reductase